MMTKRHQEKKKRKKKFTERQTVNNEEKKREKKKLINYIVNPKFPFCQMLKRVPQCITLCYDVTCRIAVL